ncbi:MAG: hypothetical protein HQM10_20960 [Candidatus Riflebacteria bacterium]|nr:hypothetical protein [Candidatus Riflebacteria bacterium]
MNNDLSSFNDSVLGFLANRNEKSFCKLIENGRTLVTGFARSWKAPQLNFFEKVREIWSEIFLILIEGFDAGKIKHSAGIASWLSLRIKRLTCPGFSKDTPFGLTGDMPDTGRTQLTPLRLETIQTIVHCIRKQLFINSPQNVQLLEFLFLHISPELGKSSAFLSAIRGDDTVKALENDKKRHQSFNHSLRREFEKKLGSEWQEITDWSFGERSHLAWSIIDFSPAERIKLGNELSNFLDQWRDSEYPFDKPEISFLKNIESGILSLKSLYKTDLSVLMEEEALYSCTKYSDDDLLESLICPGCKERLLREPEHTYYQKNMESAIFESASSAEECQMYDNAVSEVRSWLSAFINSNETSDERNMTK